MSIKFLPGSSWNDPLVGWFFFPPPKPLQCEPKEIQPPKNDGCNCKKCNNFFPFATPNQTDGTLICWACRNGY